MSQQDKLDVEVATWFRTLGIELLCQWDVLVFLHRHLASLIRAEYIAQLLGYAAGPVVAALGSLESLGLVHRSRVDQGVRLYQLTPPSDPRRGNALARLLNLNEHRAGRLLLAQQLRPNKRRAPTNGPAPLHDRGSATWLRAI